MLDENKKYLVVMVDTHGNIKEISVYAYSIASALVNVFQTMQAYAREDDFFDDIWEIVSIKKVRK